MSETQHLTEGSKKPIFPDDAILKVYSMRFCPFSHRVHLVLEAKNLPHHTIYINVDKKPEWFRQVSSSLMVPALEVVTEPGNPVIIESLIICDYLDEKYPEVPLYPDDPFKKAMDKLLIKSFTHFIETFHNLVFNRNPTNLGHTDYYGGLEIYEKELKQRETNFFGGSTPGMLDYMIWPWCERFPSLKFTTGNNFELNPKRFASLLKWRDLMLQNKAVKKLYLDGKTHGDFLASRNALAPDNNMLFNKAKRAKKE